MLLDELELLLELEDEVDESNEPALLSSAEPPQLTITDDNSTNIKIRILTLSDMKNSRSCLATAFVNPSPKVRSLLCCLNRGSFIRILTPTIFIAVPPHLSSDFLS